MTSDVLDGRLRRYVLGTLTEAECDSIEREYFVQPEALDRIGSAEDDLIDEYLSGDLSAHEHEQFERYYLEAPCHRRRVALARAIRTAASRRALERRRPGRQWLVAAAIAATVLIAAGGAWMLRERPRSRSAPLENAATSVAAPKPSTVSPDTTATRAPVPAPPVVVAVSISPILVRGADKPSTVAITPGTDIVLLLLESGEPGERSLDQGRAIVRTVAGREIWRGPAGSPERSPRKELARVEIPAELLRPDDYIIELLDTHTRGAAVERYRYFLTVRAP
jgi:hypothetical protein